MPVSSVVNVGQSITHIDGVTYGFLTGQRSILDQVSQGAPFVVLHNDVSFTVYLLEVPYLDNV